MTNAQLAYKAYAHEAAPIKTDRSLEYDVVARVTSSLKAASQDPTNFYKLATVVDENRRMWSLIAASMADADNQFPSELKAQLFYLYEFTLLHSRKVLKGDADLHALIDINLSILRGLNPGARE